jgi:dolichol kinase
MQTWAGSFACLVGSWAASLGIIMYLRAFGLPLGVGHLSAAQLSSGCALCAAAAALVESLPVKEVDNITVPLTAAVAAGWAFGAGGAG